MDEQAGRGVALISGAAKRIGRAIALDLAAHGWAIAVHFSSSVDEAEETCDVIHAIGGRAASVRADLADPSAPAHILAQARAALGPVTALINNASIFDYDDMATMTLESWDRHMAVNLRAPVFLTQAFAAALPEVENGNIINIIDQRVLKPNPQFYSYAASKAALWAATRTAAQALAPRVRVNAVAPGPTLRNDRQSVADFARQCAATPLRRGAQPDEIAAAVRFILDQPAMTGQMIALDGGQHLAWQTPDIHGIRE